MDEKNIINKEQWNHFILANNGSFLQSWEWGEFQERVAGKRVFRFCEAKSTPSGLSRAGSREIEGWAAQFIENIIPIIKKKYWYAPRAPLLKTQNSNVKTQILEEFIKMVSQEAKKEGVLFWRIGPEWLLDCHSRESGNPGPGSRVPPSLKLWRAGKPGMTGLLERAGFKRLPYDIEPSQTQILDISKTEDELLVQMHEKWRYNIRLAQKKGVAIKMIDAQNQDFEKYFEEFYRLVSKGTSERKNIKHHPKEYYRKQLEIGKNPPLPSLKEGSDSPPLGGVRGDLELVLFVAEHENKVIAANIAVFFGNRATYLHGATSSEYREVMAPHLLQWEQIKEAKRRGYVEYDFWGVVNEYTLDKRGASWEGFTRFKKGFGGQEVNYVGYWDYPIDKKWYSLYRLVQKFRR